MAEDALGNITEMIHKYMEFARRVLRRWWLIGIFTVLGAGGSVAFALNMQRVYASRTLISFKEQLNEQNVLATDGGGREENWLYSRLEETFSSNTLLWRIITDMKLFPGMRGSVAPEVVLKEMRDKIKFGIVGADSFHITFEYKDPRKCQRVTARLADEFIKANVQDSLRAANVTQTFMESEVRKVKDQLDEIESEHAQFVAHHPEFKIDPTTGLRRGLTMQAARQRAASSPGYASVSSPELRSALARKGRLQAQLQLMRNPKSDPKLVQAQQDVARARRAYDNLRRKYTSKHPDVERARRYLVQMQSKLRFAQESRSTNTAGGSSIREEIAELDRTIARLSRVHQRTVEDKKARPRPTPKTLSTDAKLEKRWYQVTRDRAVAKAKYDVLQERLLRTKVAASLERKRAETQFTIVDKANMPGKPIRPSRTKMAIAGTFLGVMLGFGLAALLVLFDPRIYNEDDLKKASDLPVLAQIPRDA